jgi:hypothetical protein
MDDKTHPHHVEEIAADYAASVRLFVAKCPENREPNSPYCHVVRFCGAHDWHNGIAARRRSPIDQYRVRTKVRRAELKWLIYILPFVDVYGNPELEDERVRLLEGGHDLLKIYDGVIKAFS